MNLANKDQVVLEDPKDLEEKKERRVMLVSLDHLDDLESLDIQVPLETLDPLEQTEFPE